MGENGAVTHPGFELLARGGVPVVLAPMAGITNRAFRRLARENARAASDGAATGIYVTEMITSRALVERNVETMSMIATSRRAACSSMASTRPPSPLPCTCSSPRTVPTTST